MRLVLKVFVAEHCPGCREARDIARKIEQDYPQLTVTVIDIDHPSEPVPEDVFATPTYLLDGRVVSLGNPAPGDIAGWLLPHQTTPVENHDGR